MTAAYILDDMPALPAKPKDPLGRHVAWVALTQAPGFIYGDKAFKVDEDFIKAQIDGYRSLTRADYTAPVLREHSRNGERSGDVLALASVVIDERLTLIGALALSDPEAQDKIKRGEIKYVSPSFGPISDDRGRDFDFALREVSLVAAPHQKHLTPGTTHVLGKEQGEMDKDKSTEQEVSTSDAPSVEERLGKMEKAIAELLELKQLMEAAMMEDDEEKEEEGPQMGEPTESPEVVSLREQVEALEDERDRAVWDQGDRRVLTVTPELDALLYAEWRKDKERVAAMLSEASKAPAKEKQPAKQPEPTPVSPWVRMSEAAPVPSGDDIKPATDADLSAKSLEMAEGDQVKALKIYKELKAQRLH
jgi:phage terminase small subunit